MSRLLGPALMCLLVGCASAHPASADEKQDKQLVVEGRGIGDMARSVWDFFFGDGEDYDYDDYGGFVNPQGGEVSSYTWYDPSSARRDSFDVTEDEDEYSWGEFALGAALAIVPIGLLLAAFPAGLFTVAVKKRSFGDDNMLDNIDPMKLPLIKSLQDGDLLSIVRPQCQKKLFCEITQLGKLESASFLQRAFYYVSHLTPDGISRRLRLKRLFDASRENQCEVFSCNTGSAGPKDSPSNHLIAPTKEKDSEQI